MYIYICTYVLHILVYIIVYVNIYAYVYICIYKYIYIYIHTHTHTHTYIPWYIHMYPYRLLPNYRHKIVLVFFRKKSKTGSMNCQASSANRCFLGGVGIRCATWLILVDRVVFKGAMKCAASIAKKIPATRGPFSKKIGLHTHLLRKRPLYIYVHLYIHAHTDTYKHVYRPLFWKREARIRIFCEIGP